MMSYEITVTMQLRIELGIVLRIVLRIVVWNDLMMSKQQVTGASNWKSAKVTLTGIAMI
jgi:hypothetical protein